MIAMEGQMVKKTSPLTLTNGHFLFNARIPSSFVFGSEFVDTDDCYGGSNGAKDISAHPHKWPLPVQCQNSFRVLHFTFRNGFLDMDACYGGSNGTKDISAHPHK